MWFNNILFHDCGGNLEVDMNNAVKFGGTPVITGRGFKIVNYSLAIDPKKVERPVLKCSRCGKTFYSINDFFLKQISVRCYSCDKNVPLEDVVMPEESGGYYCKEHGKLFTDEKKLNVKELFETALKNWKENL